MLTANDLMTIDPMTVRLDTPLHSVISMMNREGIRQFPVLDKGKLVGMVTNRDVRLAVNSPLVNDIFERIEFIEHLTVESCMTANPISVTPDTSAAKVAEMLAIYKYGALPVVDQGALVGIITVTDMLNYMAKMLKEC